MKKSLFLFILCSCCILANAQTFYYFAGRIGDNDIIIQLKKNGISTTGYLRRAASIPIELEGKWTSNRLVLQGSSEAGSIFVYDLTISSGMANGKEVITAEGEEETSEVELAIDQFYPQNTKRKISIGDAIVFYRNGINEVKMSLMSLNYKYCGKSYGTYYWAKDCDYSVSQMQASKINVEKGCIVSFNENDNTVDIYLFNKDAFSRLKNQLSRWDYKLKDVTRGSIGNTFEEYSRKDYPNITLGDESHDSELPYHVTISSSDY